MTFFKKLFSEFSSGDITMSGTWEGYYGYSKQYPERYHNKRVQFVAEITSDRDGNFTGTIKESEEGIPELAPIEGRLKGTFVRFLKTYRQRYVADEKGIQKVEGEPQKIHYEGFYDASKALFSGEWKIETVYEHAGRKFRQLSKGHWELKRKG
jgi:hypothetical protein